MNLWRMREVRVMDPRPSPTSDAEPYVRCAALLRRPRGELVAGRNVVERFHMHYFNSLVWGNDTYWLGIPTQKLPLDIWIY